MTGRAKLRTRSTICRQICGHGQIRKRWNRSTGHSAGGCSRARRNPRPPRRFRRPKCYLRSQPLRGGDHGLHYVVMANASTIRPSLSAVAVDADGQPANGYREAPAGTVAELGGCDGPSPSVVSKNIYSCCPSAAGADICWPSPPTSMLCMNNPWGKRCVDWSTNTRLLPTVQPLQRQNPSRLRSITARTASTSSVEPSLSQRRLHSRLRLRSRFDGLRAW